jgi:RNA polymerase sigma-70 factor (ECF subfamily)
MAGAILDEVESAEAEAARSSRASEEAVLVAGAKAGHAAAFGELFRRYERPVFRIAHRITRNHEDAEDVVQQAFHRAFLYLNRFLGNSTFSTWLTRIAINEALMTIRRRRHNTVPISEPTKPDTDASAEMEDSRPTPEQQYAQSELRSAVRASVLQLRPNLRAVVLLCELKDFSTEETADLLGISVSAVKARLFQARLKLRKTLGGGSQSGTRTAASPISPYCAQTAQP